MNKHIENNYWPCKDKNCWWCCDPVKIWFRKWYDPSQIPVPKDNNWNPLWISKEEIWVDEKNIDTKRIQIYECLLYNKENNNCKDYKNRPDICRNTSCIDKNSTTTIDNQQQKAIQTIFIKITK